MVLERLLIASSICIGIMPSLTWAIALSDMANGASFHWSKVIATDVGVTAVTAGGTTSAVTDRVVIDAGTATFTVEPRCAPTMSDSYSRLTRRGMMQRSRRDARPIATMVCKTLVVTRVPATVSLLILTH